MLQRAGHIGSSAVLHELRAPAQVNRLDFHVHDSRIHAEPVEEIRVRLRKERPEILHRIRSILRQEGD